LIWIGNIGFEYGLNTGLRPMFDKEDFNIVQMEWVFIPNYINTREDLKHFRFVGVNPK